MKRHDTRAAFEYKQKLQEQMNIVERRKRLNIEVLANQGGSITKAESAINQQAEDTDGYDSEDPDIFRRAENFKKILKKMDEHRDKHLLTMKGNDLRFNVYLKKLEKLSRKDLGIDLLAYKDYVNNLREFAYINKDMHLFAAESMSIGSDVKERGLFKITHQPDIDIDLEGAERVTKNGEAIIWTMKKLLRPGKSFVTERDRRAVDEFCKNIRVFLINHEGLLTETRRVYMWNFRHNDEMQKRMESLKELQ